MAKNLCHGEWDQSERISHYLAGHFGVGWNSDKYKLFGYVPAEMFEGNMSCKLSWSKAALFQDRLTYMLSHLFFTFVDFF